MLEFEADYWRKRARATVEKSQQARADERQRAKLLRVAIEYEKLAVQAEQERRDNVIRFWRK
jgi:hypothetical protein